MVTDRFILLIILIIMITCKLNISHSNYKLSIWTLYFKAIECSIRDNLKKFFSKENQTNSNPDESNFLDELITKIVDKKNKLNEMPTKIKNEVEEIKTSLR